MRYFFDAWISPNLNGVNGLEEIRSSGSLPERKIIENKCKFQTFAPHYIIRKAP